MIGLLALLIVPLILGVLIFGGFFVGTALLIAQIVAGVFLLAFIISLVKSMFHTEKHHPHKDKHLH